MRMFIVNHIEVNDKDERRCSIQCQYVQKISGIYHCVLTDEEVDNVDDQIQDDDIGYGFKRTKHCVEKAFK